ncbi:MULTISPECIES: oligosaccharide flippase family protein [Vibrio harveyi group]|uniref:oligosaccharide flippase family protein n=2 Tax=Vibrio TaxID=662 RepID=UPI0006A589D8|nr:MULTISPECIES: oligosaccharide flippase family protein [Vibrio harveyi group]EJG1621133.1 oligosaccharide flippase family protein [Vibrio parahaemolyticus]EKY4213226.1 oligosaccharide flippase family protein [Vibrio alginolyticus]ELA7819883.1 oligosaccharide flippase family protein [Vibrio alginolyticus]KOE06585.1 hypothetical protein ACS83_06035 [Vibrio alginolyticus]MDS1795609.1 oligosaccharide flippase family protein [Vibrio parahaemolyticus]
MKALMFDVLYRFLQAGVKQGFQLCLLLYGTYSLGLDKFGEFAYISAGVVAFSVFLDFGLSSTIVKIIAEDRDRKEKVLEVLVPFISTILLIISLMVYVYLYGFNEYGALKSLTVSVLVFTMPLCAVFEGFNRGILQFKKNAMSTFFSSLVALILIIPFADNYEVIGLLLVQVIYHIVLLTLLFKTCIEKIELSSLKVSKDNDFIISVFKYSTLIGIASIGQILYTKADVMILGYYDYYREISQYELIDRFFMYLVIPVALLGQVAAPRFVNSTLSLIRKYHTVSFIVIFTLSVLLSFGMFKLYGAYEWNISDKVDIRGFDLVLCILLISLPFKMFSVFQTQAYINPLGYAEIIAKTTIFFGFINVVLDLLLVSKFGFIGVFYSTAFVIVGNTLMQTIIFRVKINNEKLKSAESF